MEPTLRPLRAVHKFGGASLADGVGVRRVGAILLERAPDRPIAVVSAIEGVTAALDAQAGAATRKADDLAPLRVRHRSMLSQLGLDPELLDRHFAELATVLRSIREHGSLAPHLRDHALSFGERVSARIVAAHLSSRGVRAVPIDAFDLGLVSDSNHGRARVLPASAERVRSALARIDGVPVITGFVAQDVHGRLTTMGRNGSDLTAVLIAEAIGAKEVFFWKEVGGVMSSDPELVAGAQVLRELSYAEAAALTRHGAGVLHADAVLPLERAGITGHVLWVRDPGDPGTTVAPSARGERAIGVACRRDVAQVTLSNHVGAQELRERLDACLARAGVEAIAVVEVGETLRIFTRSGDELADALRDLPPPTSITRGLATVAAIGPLDERELSSRLEQLGIEPVARLESAAPRTTVLVVGEERLAETAQALHGVLFERSTLQRGTK